MKSRTLMLLLFTATVVNATSVAQSTHFQPHLIWEEAAILGPTGGLYDLDRDGDLDWINGGMWIEWRENRDGLGRFDVRTVITTVPIPGFISNRSNIMVEDFDGDGNLDILRNGEWFFNSGDAVFSNPQVLIPDLGLGNADGEGVYVDLDRDGNRDLLFARGDSDSIGWYENLDGQLSFSDYQVISTAFNNITASFAADLDGDGFPDALSASRSDDKIAWYRNQMDDPNPLAPFSPQRIISVDADGAEDVKAADIDGDGDIDVVSVSGIDNKLAWYENLGNETFGSQKIISDSQNGLREFLIADLDNDGDYDILARSIFDATIAWYENLGNGTFGPQNTIAAGATGAIFFAIGDIDNDGDLDILAGFSFAGIPINWTKGYWYENRLENPMVPAVEPFDAPVSKTISDLKNYPNPFHGATTISYTVDRPGIVSLRIFDLLGRELETVDNGYKVPGSYEVRIDTKTLPSGVLVYVLESEGSTIASQMVHIK